MCCADVLLLLLGFTTVIVALVNGSVPLSAQNELRGAIPYIVGVLLMAPLPVTMIVGLLMVGSGGVGAFDKDEIILQLAILALFVVPAILVASLAAKKRRRNKPKKRPRRRDDIEDDDDDRRSRRRDDDDDYPRSRRRRDDDEEDDDDRRRRRRRRDDDDD